MRLPAIALVALLPIAAHAQAPQFCISPAMAQTVAAALQQDAAVLAMLNDAAQEPARIAAAVAAQKAADEAKSVHPDGTSITAPTPAAPAKP